MFKYGCIGRTWLCMGCYLLRVRLCLWIISVSSASCMRASACGIGWLSSTVWACPTVHMRTYLLRRIACATTSSKPSCITFIMPAKCLCYHLKQAESHHLQHAGKLLAFQMRFLHFCRPSQRLRPHSLARNSERGHEGKRRGGRKRGEGS